MKISGKLTKLEWWNQDIKLLPVERGAQKIVQSTNPPIPILANVAVFSLFFFLSSIEIYFATIDTTLPHTLFVFGEIVFHSVWSSHDNANTTSRLFSRLGLTFIRIDFFFHLNFARLLLLVPWMNKNTCNYTDYILSLCTTCGLLRIPLKSKDYYKLIKSKFAQHTYPARPRDSGQNNYATHFFRSMCVHKRRSFVLHTDYMVHSIAQYYISLIFLHIHLHLSILFTVQSWSVPYDFELQHYCTRYYVQRAEIIQFYLHSFVSSSNCSSIFEHTPSELFTEL